jgi:hypothetical protein
MGVSSIPGFPDIGQSPQRAEIESRSNLGKTPDPGWGVGAPSMSLPPSRLDSPYVHAGAVIDVLGRMKQGIGRIPTTGPRDVSEVVRAFRSAPRDPVTTIAAWWYRVLADPGMRPLEDA